MCQKHYPPNCPSYVLRVPGVSNKFLLLFLRNTFPRARNGRGESEIFLSLFLLITSLHSSWNASAIFGYPSDAEHSTNMHLKYSASEAPSVSGTCRSCSRSDLFPTMMTTAFCLNGMVRLCSSLISSKLFRSVIEYTSIKPSAQIPRLCTVGSPAD